MSHFIEYLSNTPALAVGLWAALGMLVLLLVLRKPRTLVLVENEAGRLQISRHALHRLLETCCEQVDGVASARARVVKSHGKFKTTLRLKVRPDAKLDAIQGYLTQEIADIYRQNLGISAVGPVEVDVVGIIPAEKNF